MYAQDTLIIKPVLIEESIREYFSVKQGYAPDSLSKSIYDNRKISDLLNFNAGFAVKNYGSPGALSSASLRGTSGNHLQLNWNGFAVNSLTTGSVDLSQYETSFFDNVRIIPGASGSLYGSGTFGAAVDLSSKTEFGKGFKFKQRSSAGSFSDFSEYISLNISKTKFCYSFKFNASSGKNDYPYVDIYKINFPSLRREHNASESLSVMQSFAFLTQGGWKTEVHYWLIYKDIQIPEPMGSYNAGSKNQTDSVHRFMISIKKKSHKSSFESASGFFFDYLHYTDKNNTESSQYSVDSEIKTKQFQQQITYLYQLSNSIRAASGFSYKFAQVTSENYNGKPEGHNISGYLACSADIGAYKLKSSAGIESDDFTPVIPTASLSLSRLFLNKHTDINISISNKYRTPTFNELYWQPGGNINLKPETGYDIELNVNVFEINFQHIGLFKFQNSVYHIHINDMIQWLPEGGLWSPVNHNLLVSDGFESRLNYQRTYKRQKFTVNLAWYYTNAQITNTDNEQYDMPYSPAHKLSLGLIWQVKNWEIGTHNMRCSQRYTLPYNDMQTALPPYFLTDVSLSFKTKSDSKCRFGIEARNLFNTTYESVRSYIMPGRSFTAVFTFRLS